MFSSARRHMTYANVAATLALFFSMGAGAVAASHFLITSTSQIKPSVQYALRQGSLERFCNWFLLKGSELGPESAGTTINETLKILYEGVCLRSGAETLEWPRP
jgi:hypothetical protein